ncbi:hypothetical protein AB1Y20_015629 [Prymnesium parvum]|uniref:Uncharacterized protein n=1 Tax=Prymnesium parvum TaxID=97485 RepID=A0AB34JXP2_PRYPA
MEREGRWMAQGAVEVTKLQVSDVRGRKVPSIIDLPSMGAWPRAAPAPRRTARGAPPRALLLLALLEGRGTPVSAFSPAASLCLRTPRAPRRVCATAAEPESTLWDVGDADEPPSVWGDADFTSDWSGSLPDQTRASGEQLEAGVWGDSSWGEASAAGSWGEDEEESSLTTDWLSPAATPEAAPVRREIECTNVGIIATPFKRRNGIVAEVTVQHKEAAATVVTLWFANEVLVDVAGLREREAIELAHEPFAEEVVRYLRDVRGVDFADPDWGLGDDDVPFTTQYVIVRKCLSLYPDLAEHLAATLLPAEPPSRSLVELYPYADGTVRYTPDSFWETPPPTAQPLKEEEKEGTPPDADTAEQ